MSRRIEIRSSADTRREVERLKKSFVDAATEAGILCYERRDQALAQGDEASAWKFSEDALAIAGAYHAAVASLDRYLAHIETAAQS